MASAAAAVAAIFTPLPATADSAIRPVLDPAAVAPAPPEQAAQVQNAVNGATVDMLAQSLISTGMIGLGLAVGGLAIVSHRRRQW